MGEAKSGTAQTDAAIGAVEAAFDRAVEELEALARIPGVSAAGFDAREVERSAEAVAELLTRSGLERVEILRIPETHPYVVAEWMHAGRQAPTLLLYAHHDVQPPGREAHWLSPPFEPTERGDGRLYGRGVVDDKAGVVVFSEAIRAWLESAGSLPVNVKLLIEGEEEIGSAHLSEFLRAHRARLESDVMVLSDTANLATGLPSLTTSLRGLVSLDVTVRALDHPLHSGMWGGAVPDAASALGVVLGRLFDASGGVAIPGFEADLPALAPEEREALAALPYDEAEFRSDAGVVDGALLGAANGAALYERLWRKPALAVTALEGMPLATAANQLIADARARVGVRLAPGQDPARMTTRVREFLERDPPWGVEIEVESETAAEGWAIRPTGPAFEAARRALRLGYGRDPVMIGCGGTIPFVGPLTDVLGGVPALLLGLEDPICNAHGENESLHLGDFRNALRAAAALFGELATLPRRG